MNPMISRQFAAPFAASLLGMVMSASAYGQYGLQNQQGWPFAARGGSSAPSSYYAPGAPSYAPNYYVQPAPVAQGQQPAGASETGFVSAEVPNNDTAILKVQLPANAKLFFGKTEATNQSGAMRLFRSPSLDPGSNYQYDLRAQWTENGRTVERTRTVPIRANDIVNVDFTHGG
jgi:uncharacterized protein (TIGR03000 family)